MYDSDFDAGAHATELRQLDDVRDATIDVERSLLDELTDELFILEPAQTIQPERPTQIAAERDGMFRRLLATSDVLAVAFALVLTATFTNAQQVYWAMFATVVVVVPVAKLIGLYDRDANVLNHTTLDEAPRLLSLAMAMALAAFIARDLYVSGDTGIGTKQLVFLITALTVLFILGRVGARILARTLSPAERLLVIGSDHDTECLRRKITLSSKIKATVVGRVPLAFDELPTGHSKVLGSPAELQHIVESHTVDRIVVVPGNRHADEVSDILRAVKSIGVKLSVLPQMIGAIGWAFEADEVAGEQVMGVRGYRMTTSTQLVKRATDLVGASLLLLFAAPLMIVTAIAIKIDSRGPVFFRQSRIGRNGERFSIIKFRTMCIGADTMFGDVEHLNETEGLFKSECDPRITRIGGFLRRSHIDELPQLFNVLIGQMSLVGPRPLIPSEDVEITGWYRSRCQITPGITGVWQLHGPVAVPLDEMVKLDYVYVTTWSWWGDAKIMLRTARHVLLRRGL